MIPGDDILLLNDLNTKFYQINQESFSQTRNFIWEGQKKVVEKFFEPLGKNLDEGNDEVWVIYDYASGNQRFEKFLDEKVAQSFELVSIDNNLEFLKNFDGGSEGSAKNRFKSKSNHIFRFVDENLIENLLNDEPKSVNPADFIFCFGFFHHIPGKELREKFLKLLVSQLKSPGKLAISLWNFDKLINSKEENRSEKIFDPKKDLDFEIDPDQLSKEQFQALKQIDFESNDYLLRWKNNHTLRYCHNFQMPEINELKEKVEFWSNGKVKISLEEFDQNSTSFNYYLMVEKF